MMDSWEMYPRPGTGHRAQCRRTTWWTTSNKRSNHRYEGTRPALACLWLLHACKDGTWWATVRQSLAVVLCAACCVESDGGVKSDVHREHGLQVSRDKGIEGKGRAGQGRAGLD